MKPFFTEADCDVYSYPLLMATHPSIRIPRDAISLPHANAVFEKRIKEQAQVVFGSDHDQRWTELKYDSDTHRALLINIEPLEQDSAEKLLREIKDYWCSDKQDGCYWQRLVGRIEALLAKGAGK